MSKIINNLLALLLVLATFQGSVSAQHSNEKINQSVLIVGYDPEVAAPEYAGISGGGGMTEERFLEDSKTRFPAFKAFLELHFKTVKGIDARTYKPEDSKGFDVTIFDQSIAPYKEKVMEYGADGQVSKYEPAKYLTEDFDHATIFIGHTAPVMGNAIGLKLDWLCLCLDADAHHIKTNHPIFEGPLQVDLTFETKETPEGIFKYPSGKNVDAQIPMWRVQKEGYLEGKGYRVGMVSRGGGFIDSPDAEYIASGVNTKDVGAVAIGRHGNFLLWGFSASPDYMTEEAKKVFVNAVVYMKQFKGQKPIARKYNDRIAVRDPFIDMSIHSTSKKGFEDHVAFLEKMNKKTIERNKELKAKKEKGESLTKNEKMEINFQPSPIPTFENYLQRRMGAYFEEFGTNVNAYHQFLRDNREFFKPKEGAFSYGLDIDEDVKSLGISNRDRVLLTKCIKLLEDKSQKELAVRVLKRYTQQDFSTAKEWKNWFKKNKGNLFFTESGGYKWLVNTL